MVRVEAGDPKESRCGNSVNDVSLIILYIARQVLKKAGRKQLKPLVAQDTMSLVIAASIFAGETHILFCPFFCRLTDSRNTVCPQFFGAMVFLPDVLDRRMVSLSSEFFDDIEVFFVNPECCELFRHFFLPFLY